MNTNTMLKLITIIAATLFAGANLVFAGTFQITADGVVITNTNSNAASGNASFGYENYVFNTNGVNPSNAFAVGNGNSITKWEGPNTMTNLYTFGGSNVISTVGYAHITNGAAVGVANNLGAGNGSSANNTYMFGGSNSIGATNGSSITDATVAGNGNHIDTGLGGSSLTNGAAVFGNNNIIKNNLHNGIVNALLAGFNNTITGGTNVLAIGAGITANANNSGGIGGASVVNGADSYSLGNSNTIKAGATNAFVLGNNITASNANSVILGNNSADGIANAIATITIGANAPVSVSGTSPSGVVSVGAAGAERQIINVAAGRVAANSTDAINGSELYITNITLAAVSATVAALASQSAGPAIDALSWSSTLNAYDASHAAGGGAAQRITNIAAGAINATSLDAVNGSQLHGVASNLARILGAGTVNSDGSITSTTFATGGTTVNQAITNIYNTSTALAANALQWNPALNAYDASRETGVGAAQRITNVAAGAIAANSLDAVNGAQLHATNTTLASLGGTVVTLGDTVTNLGDTITTLGDTVSNLSGNATTIANLVNIVNEITTGSADIFRRDAATGDIAIATAFTGTLVDFGSATAAAAGAGENAARRLTGVANGAINATSRDAINGSQLHAVATSVAGILGTGTVNPDGSITGATFITGGTTLNEAIANLYNNSTARAADALQWNPALNAYDASRNTGGERDAGGAGGAGTAQRITNVASGLVAADSLDAINGAQLHAATTSITNALGTGAVNPDGSITNVQFTFNGGTHTNLADTITDLDDSYLNLNSQLQLLITGNAGLIRQDTATTDITIGAQTTGTLLNIANSANEDRRITGLAAGANDNDAVNLAQLKAAGLVSTSADGATAIATIVAYDDSTKTTITLGSPTVTGTGANMTGGTRITNLALAAIDAASTDAVNGSQLFATNQRVTSLETIVSTIANNSANNNVNTPAPTNTHFTTGADDQTIPATATGGNAIAAGMGATAAGASSSAIGMGAIAAAAQSVALGALSVSQATGGVALGNGAIVAATAANSIAIGANSVATEPNTVSFGTPGNERRLVNIADAIAPTDAVNMRQLTAFGDIVNNRFTNLQNQVNTIGDRVDNVGAMSAAMNQVQPRLNVSTGNRNQLALGAGGYRGHGAFAMGYGYTCPQGNRGVQASFALSDRGEVMAGAGAVFGW